MIHSKKILYLHIPKTAGTSLCSFIASHYSAEEVALHVEINPLWDDKDAAQRFEAKSFVSGHIPFDSFESKLKAPRFRIATFRKPIEHVISHMAFVRYLSEPSEARRFRDHTKQIQDISRKLAGLDLGSAGDIAAFVAGFNQHEASLFDNVQTRYLLPRPWPRQVTNAHLAEAKGKLAALDLVGISERLPEVTEALCWHMGWPKRGMPGRENVGQSTFGMDSRRQDICEALRPAIRHDEALYQEAVQLFDRQLQVVRRDAAAAVQGNHAG